MPYPDVYRYYEDGRLLSVGTIKQISKDMEIPEGKLYKLKYRPQEDKRLEFHSNGEAPIYKLKTKRGRVIFRGTLEECCDFMHMSPNTFTSIKYEQKIGKRNGKRGGYLIEREY